MAGFGGDGQYQGRHEGHPAGLDVVSHFCTLTGLNPSWVISRWDGAHRIELGMDTVRKVIPFYGKIAGIVSAAQGKYFFGKGHLRCIQAAEALGCKIRAIGVVCDTRFCQSERKVYKNFGANLYYIVRDMLTERSGEVGIAQEIATITSITWVVQLFGLIDILQHVKNVSLTLQVAQRRCCLHTAPRRTAPHRTTSDFCGLSGRRQSTSYRGSSRAPPARSSHCCRSLHLTLRQASQTARYRPTTARAVDACRPSRS
jgi:hypothetical protein